MQSKDRRPNSSSSRRASSRSPPRPRSSRSSSTRSRRNGRASSRRRESSPNDAASTTLDASPIELMPGAQTRFRIGCGAGFSGDRLDAAVLLAERGELDWLALECLAERTIALAQLRRRKNADEGFDPQLRRRMEALLPIACRSGMRIITNMGAANPLAAGQAIVELARRLGLRVRIAV